MTSMNFKLMLEVNLFSIHLSFHLILLFFAQFNFACNFLFTSNWATVAQVKSEVVDVAQI